MFAVHANPRKPRIFIPSKYTRYTVCSKHANAKSPPHTADTNEWSSPCTVGTPPTPRQGHISVVVENKLLVHGGMAGQDILSDLHILDLGNCKPVVQKSASWV